MEGRIRWGIVCSWGWRRTTEPTDLFVCAWRHVTVWRYSFFFLCLLFLYNYAEGVIRRLCWLCHLSKVLSSSFHKFLSRPIKYKVIALSIWRLELQLLLKRHNGCEC